ncbi:hypothetical protein Mh1950_23880 [Mannheimia haemolytica]|nr:hypothetical protein B824_25555 [Mannheimia haemolytica USDA-ARS-USMARC-184]
MKYPLKIYFFVFIVWYLAFLMAITFLVILINIYFYLFVLKLNVTFISLFDETDIKLIIFMPIISALGFTGLYFSRR